MSYLGTLRGRRKANKTIRLEHLGTGNCNIYRDNTLAVADTNVSLNTTGWREIFSSSQVVDVINFVEIDDTSGELFILGFGGTDGGTNPPATVHQHVFRGGNGWVPMRFESGLRITIRVVTADPVANTDTSFNFYK